MRMAVAPLWEDTARCRFLTGRLWEKCWIDAEVVRLLRGVVSEKWNEGVWRDDEDSGVKSTNNNVYFMLCQREDLAW